MKKFRAFVVVVLLSVLIGCSSSKIPASADVRKFYWPLPPDRPRIEWLNTYSSQLDLPKDFMGRLRAMSLGEDEPITLRKPIDVAAVKGLVVVADPGASSLYFFDTNRNELRVIPENRSKDSFTEPIGVTVDDEGGIYVLDGREQKIYVVDEVGEIKREVSLAGVSVRAVGICFDSVRKRLLIADAGADQIIVLSPIGKTLFTFGRSGGGDGQFNVPVDIAVSANGNIVVADAMNARVQIFTSDGTFIRRFGRRGDGLSDFQQIKGVATDSDNNIYVTDARSHRMMIFNPAAEFLLAVGGFFPAVSSQQAPGGFALPQGLFIDKNDVVYVVDQMNRRVQVFRYLPEGKSPAAIH